LPSRIGLIPYSVVSEEEERIEASQQLRKNRNEKRTASTG